MAVDDAYTKALLHFDGADDSTTFTDESGKVWTRNGDTKLKTATKKFGTASGYFDGTTDWIDTPDHADFDVGSGDFTVDFWVNTGSVSKNICGQNNAAADSIAMYIYTDASGHILFNIFSGGTNYRAEVSTAINDNLWHHIAGIRNGNNMYLALDGTLTVATDVTGVSVNNITDKWSIGRAGEYAGTPHLGYIDEFRFSKGIARWTANFTPPTREYRRRIPQIISF